MSHWMMWGSSSVSDVSSHARIIPVVPQHRISTSQGAFPVFCKFVASILRSVVFGGGGKWKGSDGEGISAHSALKVVRMSEHERYTTFRQGIVR